MQIRGDREPQSAPVLVEDGLQARFGISERGEHVFLGPCREARSGIGLDLAIAADELGKIEDHDDAGQPFQRRADIGIGSVARLYAGEQPVRMGAG